MEKLPKVNLEKELKIVFVNEEKINDAGGLLREWIHMITKTITSQEIGKLKLNKNLFLGLFKISDSDDVFYKFNVE